MDYMPVLSRKHWVRGAVVNVAGVLLVFLGATFSSAVQLFGFILLLPGSLIASILPLHKLWHPVFGRCCQTDSIGLSNALYLPVALLVNCVAWWGFRAYSQRRGSQTPKVVRG